MVQGEQGGLMILDLPSSMVQVPENQKWIIDMIQNILIEVLSSIAEQERLTIRKKAEGRIEAAKRKGKHLGRPYLKVPDNFEEVYAEWKSEVITARAAQKKKLECPVRVSTVW